MSAASPRPDIEAYARDVLATVGRSIRTRRAIAGMTQRQLAKEAGVDPSWVCRLEKGERDMTMRTLARIGLALGVRGSDLLYPVEVVARTPGDRWLLAPTVFRVETADDGEATS